MSRKLHGIRASGVLCLLGLSQLLAQEFRATMNGRVVDPSNAAIPNIAVQVSCDDTKENA